MAFKLSQWRGFKVQCRQTTDYHAAMKPSSCSHTSLRPGQGAQSQENPRPQFHLCTSQRQNSALCVWGKLPEWPDCS
jgi:hypothetical protein